jgi:hypothetical protein
MFPHAGGNGYRGIPGFFNDPASSKRRSPDPIYLWDAEYPLLVGINSLGSTMNLSNELRR